MLEFNSTITLQGLQNGTHGKCSDDGIRIKKIAPNALLQGSSEARVYCSLRIPNVNGDQPGCNFSLYINPSISNITVGESVDLTCPQSATNMTWWEIRSKELISLEPNVSVVSHKAVAFHASTPNENGFIIMCKDGVMSGDTEIVLGIGKVTRNRSIRNFRCKSLHHHHLHSAYYNFGCNCRNGCDFLCT